MAQSDSGTIVQALEQVVACGQAGREPDAVVRSALVTAIEWLAERVPAKTELPRGYQVLWIEKPAPGGGVQRSHQLLKAATESGPGIWIDTANIDQADKRDVRLFAADIGSGLINEFIAFLRNTA